MFAAVVAISVVLSNIDLILHVLWLRCVVQGVQNADRSAGEHVDGFVSTCLTRDHEMLL